MTAWPEGRKEFVCTIPAEKGEERWLGEVVVKRHSTCMAELLIYGRDSRHPLSKAPVFFLWAA